MVFSSATFLFYFFPLFLLAYYALPWKNAVLLIGSLLFYAWGEPRFVPLLLLSALLNYSFGTLIARSAAQRRQLVLVLGVTANLLFLLYYKYFGFLVGLLNDLLPAERALQVPSILLPLGISFFTFQGISYLIDLYRGDIAVQSSFLRFAMYKAMFPQLIAGPIVRYRQIAHEIEQRDLNNDRLWAGFRLFVIGLAQKMLIANTVALSADRLFAQDPAQLTSAGAWIGIACYTIQILFDFGGYSNMAIGIGHMLGFSYPPNFQRPYSSLSVTEFWRRWHISLSSWFRDYLYIPLGGNRHGALRTYFNLGLVFLLCGLWHGAAWTFVIWGAWHGALLIIERLGVGAWLARAPALLAQAYTLLVVMLGWVFFRADSVPHALSYLRSMAGLQAPVLAPHAWQIDFTLSSALALAAGILLATVRLAPASLLAPQRLGAALGRLRLPLQTLALAAALLVCVMRMAAGTYNPFIYFRF
jgi:alginate O-acetyltransferase complex protein AlgI